MSFLSDFLLFCIILLAFLQAEMRALHESDSIVSQDLLRQPNHSLIWKEGSCSTCPTLPSWLHAFTAYFEAATHQIPSSVTSLTQDSAGSAHRGGTEHQTQHRAGLRHEAGSQRSMVTKSLPFGCEKPIIRLSSLGNRSFSMFVIDAHPRLQCAKVSTRFTYMHLVKGCFRKLRDGDFPGISILVEYVE